MYENSSFSAKEMIKIGQYKGYTPEQGKATVKYIREKQKEINLRFTMREFDTNILPYIEESGLPIATFIKNAIKEKIERDFHKKL